MYPNNNFVSRVVIAEWYYIEIMLLGKHMPQVEEFKYLGILFTTDGRKEREIYRRFGAAAAVM